MAVLLRPAVGGRLLGRRLIGSRGPAYTVVCVPRDNIMLQVAIAYAAAGDVVVASAGECTEAGCFGDVLANACLTKGLGGLLTDSGAFLRGSRTAPFLRPPLGWLTGTDRT